MLEVTDDGCGIPAEELALAFTRHATSKIEGIDDLQRLASLGFRGEALPSIAPISEVRLASATADRDGAAITVRYGETVAAGPRGRPPGTTVTVRDLFGNVPARRAFLRAPRVESARIGDLVRRLALARPDVAFTLTFDGRPAFRTDGGGDQRRTLAAVYGARAVASLAALAASVPGGGTIAGYIGAGGPWDGSRAHVAVFVNGRWTPAAGAATALESAYRPFAPAGRHPVALLRIDVPPEQVDPNVHPAKLDVRLLDERGVADALREAVSVAFGRTPAGVGAGLSRQFRLPFGRRVADRGGEYQTAGPSAGLDALVFLTGTDAGLLVAQGRDGLYLVDQHRAHERVLYEALRAGGDGPSQAMLEPALFHPSGPEAARLAERVGDLARLGFVMEDFGAGAVVARAAPAALGALGGEALLELLRAATSESAQWRDHLLATAACRAAVKKGQPLPADAARALLVRTAGTESPAVCPHGAPIVLRLDDGLLSRLFRW
ncbi:MAG: DNA mismatch repair endonuclease MutL [Dehalococcoidia bacterium]